VDSILFIIALILLGTSIATIVAPEPKAVVEECRLHDWSFHPQTNILTCTKCGKKCAE
jgi:hypothetical protein